MKESMKKSQKKMTEMFIAIIESDIEGNYELQQIKSKCGLVFNYHFLELRVALDFNAETYTVYADENKYDLLFASKNIEEIVDFIEKQIEKMNYVEVEKPIAYLHGTPVYTL